METARLVSTWSKDPSTKVGAVCVNDDKRIQVTGYNGFPSGLDDSVDNYLNKEEKYDKIIHAEMNCIFNAVHQGESLKGSTIYVYGLPTCSACCNGIIQSGIKHVVMHYRKDTPQTWVDSWKKSEAKYLEAGVGFHWIDDDGQIFYKLTDS